MSTQYTLRYRCIDVGMQARHLEDMYDASLEITYATFLRHCPTLPELARTLGYAVGSEPGLHLRNDHYVRYFRSKYKGQPCYYLAWSSIDHIFLQGQA